MRAPGEQVGADGDERDGAVERTRVVRELARERRHHQLVDRVGGAHDRPPGDREQGARAAVRVEERAVRLGPVDPLVPERLRRGRVGVRRGVRAEEVAVVARSAGSRRSDRPPREPRPRSSTVNRGYVVRCGAARKLASGTIRSTVTIVVAAAFTSSASIQTSFGSTRTLPRASAASRVDDRDVEGERGAGDEASPVAGSCSSRVVSGWSASMSVPRPAFVGMNGSGGRRPGAGRSGCARCTPRSRPGPPARRCGSGERGRILRG